MMTGVIGAGLPLPSTATPAEGGDGADPAGAQSFLAALAAAVAAPAPPPEPLPSMVVVVPLDVMVPSDGAAPDAAEESETSLTADAQPGAVEEPDRATDAGRIVLSPPSRPERALAEAAPSGTPRREHATAMPLRSEPARDSATRGVERTPDASVERPDESGRAEPALPADPDVRSRTPGQGDAIVPAPATPSLHASAHAWAAPPRQQDQGSDLPMPEAPSPSAPPAAARPASTAAGGSPASSASATAAGVLAAMHVARESLVTAPALPDDAVVTVLPTATAPMPAEGVVMAAAEFAHDTQPAIAEPIEVLTSSPRGEPVVPRPLGVVAAGADAGTSGSGDHGRGADRESQQPTVVTASPEQPAPVQAPWLATTAPSTDSGPTSVSLPAAPPAADAPPPRVATSHVTVELDQAQSGAERVRVAVRGDVVHATVVTDRGGVDAMRPQLDQLRQALEGQGFREAHVQVRSSSGESPGAMPSVGVADVRPRADASSRTADGNPSEQQQPRGRHRGQDQSPPESRHHEHEEEIL